MALSVAAYREDPVALELRGRDTQSPSIERGGVKTRIRALVGFWENLRSSSGPETTARCKDTNQTCRASFKHRQLSVRDLYRPSEISTFPDECPPSYEDCTSDLPPDYTTTDTLATARSCSGGEVLDVKKSPENSASTGTTSLEIVHNVEVDFAASDNIRTRGKKQKAKQAAKQAQAAKWTDGDNEGKKDGGEDGLGGDDNGGGGNAGSGGDGGGADPPGGDGGDDGDGWWNAGAGGNKKDKKKKKKNAWEEFEEEEKKREEEEAKKAEEEAAGGTAEAEADPIDEWGSFAAVGKKGKKKKDKTDPEPPPDPEPAPETSAAADAGGDDDWGGFMTTSKKKKGKKGKDAEPEPKPDPVMDTIDLGASANGDAGADDWANFALAGKKKKGKKGKEEPAPEPVVEEPPPPPEPAANDGDDWLSLGKKGKKDKKKGKNDPASEPPKDTANDMRFDDINLNDDKSLPKLDLDFGLKKAEEPKSSGFSFGGWGSGWGGSSWGFGGGSSDPPAESKQEETGWSFTTSAKKDKNKKVSNDFDFSFDSIDHDIGSNAFDLGASTVKEEPKAEDDVWGGFGAGKKDKKSKKKGVVEPEPAVEVPPPVEDKPAEDDLWGGFSTKKDKKTKKKATSIWESEPVAQPEPVVAPVPEPIKEEEDLWGTFSMSAKDKKKAAKKATKAAKEEPPEEPAPLPEPEAAPAPAQEDAFEGWGVTTKKTKKGKKGQLDPEPIVEASPPPPEVKPVEDDPWATFGSTDKKKKKKTGFGFDWADEPMDPVIDNPPVPPVIAPEVTTDWLGGGWGDAPTTKKGKKTKKGAVEEAPPALPPPPPVIEPAADDQAADDDWFGGWSKKDKKKKAKNELAEIPDPPTSDNALLMPEAVVEPKIEGDDDWTAGWSTGTKKKASKKDKSKGIVEVLDPSPGASVLLPESVQEKSAEDDPWANWTTGKKAKVKTGKKGGLEVSPSPVPTPPGLSDDAAAGANLLDVAEPSVDDLWSLTTTTKKKGKTDKKSSQAADPPKVEEVKLTKTKSKDSKASVGDMLDIAEEGEPAAEVEAPKEKKEDKKASSAWGGIWGSTTTKKETPREKREREKREREEREAAEAEEAQRKADEEAFAAALGDDPDDVLDFEDEPAPPPKKSSSKDKDKDKDKDAKDKDAKDSKKKTLDKLTKVDSKASKKSASKEASPIVELPEPEPMLALDEPKQAEGWGFWGSSLKSTKKATAAVASNGKIGPDPWANQDASLTGLPKMPDLSLGNDLMESAVLPPKSAASKSKGPSTGSSIQDRIKALHGESLLDAKPSKAKKSAGVPPPPPPEPEAEPEPEPLVEEPAPAPVPEKKSKKSSAATKTSKKDKKEALPAPEPVPVPAPPPSVSPVPGGFPIDDFLEDEPAPADEAKSKAEMLPSPPKKTSKEKKASKSTKKESKPKTEPIVTEAPSTPADFGNLLGDVDEMRDEPRGPPTPPPDDSTPKEKKSTKKERPKVVRDHASTSWGFWGATPVKKSTKKSKDKDSKDGTVSPTTRELPAGVVRSKSARKASDKDPLEKASKSSGSEKDGKKDSRSRPNTSRGTGFSSMFSMGAPPSRSRSTRQPAVTTSSSRRRSTAVENSGLISPPPEREIPAKAAKVVGLSRSKSTREKGTRRIPDPYAIDSDDMMIVDGPEDSAKDIEEPRKRSSKSKRQSSYMSGGLGTAEDDIMVDAPRQSDDAKAVPGPDELAFAERPGLVRRSTSNAKKAGLMGGLLGAFSSRPAPERRTSRAYDSEDTRRKRSSGYDDEYSKRLRREDRTVNRSRKTSAGDGLTDVEDPEAKEARRRERRERREREAAEEEARQARRRNRAREEEQRQIREEEEREARRREERRARRAEKEARRAEEDRLAREEEKAREERRERRRERERQEEAAAAAAAARPKTDRRRSYMDTPDDDEARRMRREERRLRRSVDQGADMERPRTSRRRSEYPAPVDGEPLPHPKGAFTPVAHAINKSGGDKTASWVHSFEEPPPPPPIEATIIDAPMHFAEDNTPDPLGETTAREFRSRRRREREDEDYERRRRRREAGGMVKSSDGSSHDRRRSYASPSMDYDDSGARPFDGRPAMAHRRGSSWLKKIAGL